MGGLRGRGAGGIGVPARNWRRRDFENRNRANACLQRGGCAAISERAQGIDVDAIAPQVEGKFASAFIRARKPATRHRAIGAAVLRAKLLRSERCGEGVIERWTGTLQRSLSLHRQFGAVDHGRGDFEPEGPANFSGYSAGSHPAGRVRPEALRQLELAHLPTNGLRSKNWDEFAKPGAPRWILFSRYATTPRKEVCPVWPGQPMTAHWGFRIRRRWKAIPKRSSGRFAMHS